MKKRFLFLTFFQWLSSPFFQHHLVGSLHCFRNAPSVKSTSVSLSMLMFTGCYIVVAFEVSYIIYLQYWLDTCMFQVWLSIGGLSFPRCGVGKNVESVSHFHYIKTINRNYEVQRLYPGFVYFAYPVTQHHFSYFMAYIWSTQLSWVFCGTSWIHQSSNTLLK